MQTIKKIIAYKIIANTEIAHEHFIMQIDAPWLAKHSIAGQFVTVKVQENTTDPLLRIPLAVYDIDDDNISLLYNVVGKATKILSTKKAQENISVLGPLGNGFTIQEHENAVLVAGGSGIAPLYLLARTLIKKNKKISIFIGAFNKQQILCVENFTNLGAEIHIATEDGSQGYKGLITDLLIEKIKNAKDITIYASGPQPMLFALTKIAQQLNIPAQLSMEAYMACGIGVCKGCAIPTKEGYKLCCKDGPVFNASNIEV
jgi:dihydroorotate dehydrogenase electron transfer subunit